MTAPKTFLDESFLNRKINYTVDECGLTCKREHDEEVYLKWQDIDYIEDLSGVRVDIVANKRKQVPVRYATNEFPVLLKTICLKVSEIRPEISYPQTFTLTRKYWFHVYFVVSVFAMSLIGSLLYGKVLFFTLLTLSVPFGIFLQRIPISLTLNHHRLRVRGPFFKRTVLYSEVRHINFEVKKNDYGNTLCILIHLKNGKKITVKKIDNLILFFIMLQVKLNEK